LPSIDQVMPWLHLVFDAWEDHRKMREREASEREAAERAEVSGDPEHEEHGKKKKKRKDKDKK
jgi:hypothetical protein